MKVKYNLLLVMSYVPGVLLFVERCVYKLLGWLYWTAQAELSLWLVCIVVYGLHTVFLIIGYKKKLLQWEVLKGIYILDMVVFLPQIVLIVLSHIFSFGSKDLQTTLSDIQYILYILLAQIAILVARKVSNSFFCNKIIDEVLSKKRAEGGTD